MKGERKVAGYVNLVRRANKLEQRIENKTKRERAAVEKAEAALKAKLESESVVKLSHQARELRTKVRLKYMTLTGGEQSAAHRILINPNT